MQLESPETWEEVGIDAILQDERRLIALWKRLRSN